MTKTLFVNSEYVHVRVIIYIHLSETSVKLFRLSKGMHIVLILLIKKTMTELNRMSLDL